MDLHEGTPFWPKRDGLPSVHDRLRASTTCDVAVVGGGITGALVAVELVERGLDVVVLDRRGIGGGSTSASTSMLQYEIDELLIDLTDAIGPDRARLAYRECSRGIDLVERATQTIGDLCGFRRSPSVFVAKRKGDVATVQRECEARAEAGFDVRWLDAGGLHERWGLVGHGAVESAQGASIDPYLFAHAALDHVVRRGGRVHGRTAVEAFTFSPRRVELATDRGVTVRARWVVVATGYEVDDLLPALPIALRTTFAFVSEPIRDLRRRYPDGLLFWDYDDPYLYGRTTDDDRLLVGGGDAVRRGPVWRRNALPGRIRSLQRTVATRLPGVEVDVAYRWAGTFAETPDGLAYIGRHPSLPRARFALGFGGNGITYSALAAQYIADDLVDRAGTEGADLFRLDRDVIRPS